MDDSQRELAQLQEPHEVTVQRAYEDYDQAVLGVECAWPAAEREAPLRLS